MRRMAFALERSVLRVKVVGFGDKPLLAAGLALSALEERASGGEVACFGLDEDVW